MTETAAADASATRKGRSPFVLILVPLLVLVAATVVFGVIAGGNRSDAESAVDAAVEQGLDQALCEGADGRGLSLDGLEPMQPLVLSSLTLDRAAISFVSPTIEAAAGDDAETDDATDDEAIDGDDNDETPVVNVVALELEKQSTGWCVADAESSVRPADN